MKYIKFFLRKIKNFLLGIIYPLSLFLFYTIIIVIYLLLETEDLSDYINLNPFDYCNLTDVDYTAELCDDSFASVTITEYLTFDVHAASENNPFRELWRELPEDTVDGVRVTYKVESVSQILDDGSEIPYTETSQMYWEDEDYLGSDSTFRWHHSRSTGYYPDNDESLLIYIPWTYRDTMKFKIVYRMNNASLKYNDCSELYLSMYSGRTIKKLNSFKAQILIPSHEMPSTYYAYTFGTANSRIPFKESDTRNKGYHTFFINLDKSDLKFNFHNRYIEFCLLAYGNDKHIFTEFAPDNLYTNQDVLYECIKENEYYTNLTQKFNTYKTILLISSIIISPLVLFTAKRKYIRTKEKYTFYDTEIEYQYFRDIPSDLDPIFASELVFMKDPFNENKEKKEEYAAILLSLARKKYVNISRVNPSEEWSPSNTLITLEAVSVDYSSENLESVNTGSNIINEKTNECLEDLTTSERLYFELLERHTRYSKDSYITLSRLQSRIDEDFEYTQNFVKDMEKKPALENGVIKGYFQEKDYEKAKQEITKSSKESLIISIILLILVNGISYFTPMALGFGAYTILSFAFLARYVYLASKADNLILLTQYGANEQEKWYGLYNFLNSDTLINEKEVHELPLWEKYLIYATAFGISEKVIKAIQIRAKDLNIESSPILNHHCYIHSTNFHSAAKSFGHSIHTSTRGGGSFAGHGYGGGGRRRWWRWRRSLNR